MSAAECGNDRTVGKAFAYICLESSKDRRSMIYVDLRSIERSEDYAVRTAKREAAPIAVRCVFGGMPFKDIVHLSEPFGNRDYHVIAAQTHGTLYQMSPYHVPAW